MRQAQVGEWVYISNIDDYAPPYGVPCKVIKSALGMTWVRPKGTKKKSFSVDDKHLLFIVSEILSGEEKREILYRLVKAECIIGWKSEVREFGILNKLIKRYPNLEFWREFTPDSKAESMSWYINSEVIKKSYFHSELDTLITKNDNKGTLGNTKIGDDVVIKRKPKTILDL